MEKNIINNLVGLKLTVRFHTGNRKHKDLQTELETNHNITGKRSVGASVKLFGEQWQRDITTAESQLRQWIYHRTLPWQDGGLRVIPASQYLAVFDEFVNLKADFDRAVDKLLADYDAVKADCQSRLNGAYREDMFPRKWDLQHAYSCSLDTQPIAIPSDFRVEGLDQSVIERIQNEAWDHVGKALDVGVKDLTATVAELLSDAKDRIERAGTGEKIKIGTLTDKAAKCVERIRNLNVTGDSVLARAADQIEATLTRLDAEQIKTDKSLRERIKRDTAKIMSDFTGEAEEPEVIPEPPAPKAQPKPKAQPVSDDVLDCI